MAGNFQADGQGDILVENSYNNIIVVDPNKTIRASNGTFLIEERQVDHENLIMYANLEVSLLPRTRLNVGGDPAENQETISIASVNFLKPNSDEYLNTGYYDTLTGLGGNEGKATNQRKEEVVEINGRKAYKGTTVTDKYGRTIDSGLLGITSIQTITNLSFIPEVTIEFEDVQGKALFEMGDQSPYAAFFNLPYPPFYLTLKGYYGQAIRYQLNLEKFESRFNSQSGNYQITCRFKGYKYNILNEIQLGHLIALPHMYSKTFNITQTPVTPLTANDNDANNSGSNLAQSENSNLQLSIQTINEKGRQKINELYSEYEAKGLISPNFPRLSLADLAYRLQLFEQNVENSYKKVDFQVLTDGDNYRTVLQNYFSKVRGDKNSWFITYLNTSAPYYLIDDSEVYVFKNTLDVGQKKTSLAELQAIIINYNKKLSENQSFGDASKTNLYIPNPINLDSFLINLNFGNVDWIKTFRIQTDSPFVPDPVTLSSFIATKMLQDFAITVAIQPDGSIQPVSDVLKFFIFDGPNRFDKNIASMEGQLNKKITSEQTRITEELSDKLENAETGIGFRPTVRNVSAVIMASAEAFIRLLDDVHLKAWEVRQDQTRRDIVLNKSSAQPSSDDVNFVGTTTNASQAFVDNSLSNIYPWPQVFVTNEDPNKPKYELMYPGDPDYVNLTKGYLYDKWPEVEFVEEYLKGTAQRYQPPVAQPPADNEAAVSNIININALEFPINSLAYLNKEEIKFFYEIYERQLIYSYYTNLGRVVGTGSESAIVNIVDTVESQNIVSSLGDSNPYLSLKLKNYPLSAANYVDSLENFSNQGTGLFWGEFIQDKYITSYLTNRIENSLSIENLSTLGNATGNNNFSIPAPALLNFSAYLASNQSNPLTFTDTFPFTDNTWNTENLSNYIYSLSPELANRTANTLTIYRPKNIIANFNESFNVTTNRPVTSFNYLNTSQSNLTTLNDLVTLISDPAKFTPTVGTTITPSNLRIRETSTSMLNTPYFINAILLGVQNEKNRIVNPYKVAAYLFLNSLPLATLRERYKSNDKPELVGDYIFASFRKFGTLNKVPYVWVLKLGSIWHRYKTFTESNTDILDPVWANFNFVNAYDPVTNNPSKTYIVNTVGSITLQLETMIGATKNTNLQVGFYPKVINDFNYFYNGTDLYTQYTDGEINESIKNGLKVQNISESNINKTTTKDNQQRVVGVKTYSVLLPNNITPSTPGKLICNEPVTATTSQFFVVPSFGSTYNQVNEECFNATGLLTQELLNNNSVYNGSVRLFWDTSNYGYFDTTPIQKPTPLNYFTKIEKTGNVAPLKFLSTPSYSEIEELLAVFSRKDLDEMERHFLNFSQPLSNFKLEPNSNVNTDPLIVNALNNQGGPYSVVDITNRNFQQMFRSLMTVSVDLNAANGQQLFEDTIKNQYRFMMSEFKNIMEYDVVIRVGNPTKYNRRAVSSYLGYVTNTSQVVNPIPFEPYVPTLSPAAQTEFLLNIGFSSNPFFISYADDFFTQSNIAITPDSTRELSQICRQYVTQRFIDPNLTIPTFAAQIQTYLDNNQSFFDESLTNTLIKARKGLPNISQVPESRIQSQFNFKQAKVDLYEAFKAINDKWISGNDYKRTTLFEDMLFLDRASRDVGDKILIDIFQLKRVVDDDSINYNMSVFVYLAGILTENNFNIMPLPAYVNFYNVQDATRNAQPNIPNSQEFANDMWGTFPVVDYRKSGPKLVCFYVDRPSSYVDMSNKERSNFLYRSDSFDLRDPNNPLNEVVTANKNDYAFSNMCVGFSVDIGTRNQNVFYSFSVSQFAGKATAESVATINDMASASSGRDTTTPNTSLYNLYQNQSYECEVVCLGNALLQPTMYFILRHVPMFYGSYMVTEVSHTITPGTFQTKFKGIRQSFLSYPYPDNLLASLNQNVFEKVYKSVLNRKDDTQLAQSSTIQANNAKTSTTTDSKNAPENSCENSVLETYKTVGYNSINGTETSITSKEFIDGLRLAIPNNTDLQFIVYCISFAACGNTSNGQLKGFNNNFGRIVLNYDFGEMRSFFQQTYSCSEWLDDVGIPYIFPIAHFENLDRYLNFCENRLELRIQDINNRSIEQYYLQNWPYNTNRTINTSENLKKTLTFAKKQANNLGLVSNVTLLTPEPTPIPNPNNQNLINNVTPTCPTPTP